MEKIHNFPPTTPNQPTKIGEKNVIETILKLLYSLRPLIKQYQNHIKLIYINIYKPYEYEREEPALYREPAPDVPIHILKNIAYISPKSLTYVDWQQR